VYVDNQVNLAAVAEWEFGVGRGVNSLVCLIVGTGTGAGMILNGSLFRGYSHAAGEIGWLLHNESLCRRRFPALGRSVDLHQGEGMPQRVFDTLEVIDKEYLAGNFNIKDLSNPVALRTNPSLRLVNNMTDYLTLAIASLCAVVNPATVVLAGDISKGARLLADRLGERLHGKLPLVPRIFVSELGQRAVALGAVMMVLDATTLNTAIANLP